MRGKFAYCLAFVGAALCGSAAQADQAGFNLSGSGIGGSILITYVANPNTGPLGASPNLYDPVGSYVVTGISGSFSDSNIGLASVAIDSIVPSNPGLPTSDNLLAPHSFGWFPITNGPLNPEGATAPGFSYDNLFYPAGSPQTATSYPFSGGVLDIYGLVFNLANGESVNLWSNGNVPGVGLNYGVGVTNGTDVLDYESPVSLTPVPEPATWAMMLVGFAAVGMAARRRRKPLLSPATA